MILSQEGNPYYLTGPAFRGIGGPHIGLTHAWPMSVLVQAMTSNDDDEIEMCLGMVKNVSMMGLINESVNVMYQMDTTRKFHYFMAMRLPANASPRKLVCLGEFSFCADNS